MRSNPTEAEAALWRLLRNKRPQGWKFKRQQPIRPYIVDFVCFEARLIIEADGSQHIDSTYDSARDRWLQGQGFRILRFYNNDVLARPESVLTSVLTALESSEAGIEPASPLPLSPTLPRKGGGRSKEVRRG